jgi:hypothetical protein
MIAPLYQILSILVSLAFVAVVLMAATGVVLVITQFLFPRLSERIRQRLAARGGEGGADGG